jgi:hypothetical protein
MASLSRSPGIRADPSSLFENFDAVAEHENFSAETSTPQRATISSAHPVSAVQGYATPGSRLQRFEQHPDGDYELVAAASPSLPETPEALIRELRSPDTTTRFPRNVEHVPGFRGARPLRESMPPCRRGAGGSRAGALRRSANRPALSDSRQLYRSSEPLDLALKISNLGEVTRTLVRNAGGFSFPNPAQPLEVEIFDAAVLVDAKDWPQVKARMANQPSGSGKAP